MNNNWRGEQLEEMWQAEAYEEQQKPIDAYLRLLFDACAPARDKYISASFTGLQRPGAIFFSEK